MRLILLFVVVPAAELALLIEIGSRIGTPATLGLIVATGLLGATLARRQGLQVLGQVQSEVAEGRIPAGSLVDGLLILIAGALLVTPGVLTDAFGFLCLTPVFRSMITREVLRRLERAIIEQRVNVAVRMSGYDDPLANPRAHGEASPEIDVTPDSEETSRRTLH